MAKKEDKKKSEAEKLKVGDVITTDKGESFELDDEQANCLNDQMSDAADESKDEPAAPASKKTGNVKKAPEKGTFRFNNKFKRK